MAFCVQCGAQLKEGDRFCSNCGYEAKATATGGSGAKAFESAAPIAQKLVGAIVRDVEASGTAGEMTLASWQDGGMGSALPEAMPFAAQAVGAVAAQAQGAVAARVQPQQAAYQQAAQPQQAPYQQAVQPQQAPYRQNTQPQQAPYQQAAQPQQIAQATYTQPQQVTYQQAAAPYPQTQPTAQDNPKKKQARKPTVRYSSSNKGK